MLISMVSVFLFFSEDKIFFTPKQLGKIIFKLAQ
jgi:hypothetical protein